MAKKETLFPFDSIGGRVQYVRYKKGLSRPAFHDLVMGKIDISDDDKRKTIYNWESSSTMISLDNIQKIARACDCSADFLLCLNECTNKNTQFISDETGLSENAIKFLNSASHNLSVLYIGDNDIKDHVNDNSMIIPLSDILERAKYDMLLFCDKLLKAGITQEILNSNAIWDDVIKKDLSPDKIKKKTTLSFADYDDLRNKQEVSVFSLTQEMQRIIQLLAESIKESPMK